ncbi:hypothetical protein K1W69_26660 [Hoeflea sp. WL0058]|uniref:Uncharacterized protein n=1 Tax=Flavimaribacter sediminis TaxID=2865987 RepID=A0AAE2ZTV2_9HYPH|nr:hypothetical protein [Flavimaribacter sediminis]MBW8640801.1 hypothetical protein [Flavimaribacter sediminis]
MALFREFGILRLVRRVRRQVFGLGGAIDPGLERLFPPGAGLVAVAPQQAAGIFHAARSARVYKRGDEAHHPAVFRPGETFAGERPLHQFGVVAMVRVGGGQVYAGFKVPERAFAGFKPGLGFRQRQGAEAALVAGNEIGEAQIGPAEDDAEPQADARLVRLRGRAVPAGVAGNSGLAGRRFGACAFGGVRPVAAGDVGCHCSVWSGLKACDRVCSLEAMNDALV